MSWLRRKPKWKPCVPIHCTPAEEIEVSFTVIRCPTCDAIPYSEPSMWEVHDRYEWICSEHGVVFIATRGPDGRVEMEAGG